MTSPQSPYPPAGLDDSFRLLVDSIQDYAIFLMDTAGAITLWNTGAAHLTGYDSGEILGKNFSILFPKEAREEGLPNQRLQIAAQTGRCEEFDWRVRRNGTRFRANIIISALRNSTGSLTGFSEITRDVDQRKEPENESRQKLASIVEFSDDAIIGKDLDGIVTSWNKGAERIFGYSANEMLGTSITRLIPTGRLSEEALILSKIRNGDCVQHFETIRRTKDARLINVSVTSSPIKDAHGKIVGASKVARDITEQKKSREILRRQAGLFDQMYDAAIVWEWEGAITFWNRGAERLYGFPRETAVGQVSHKLLQTTIPGGVDLLVKALNVNGFWEGELNHVTEDGRHITVESRMTLVQETGRAYVLEANRDVTERRLADDKISRLNAELEERVEQRTAQLLAANRELEAFSYSVSHDLRAPLRAIDGYSQLVLEDYGSVVPEECRNDLQTIRHATQRMGNLIDDLLAFSRLSRAPLKKSTVKTSALVAAVVTELKAANEGRKMEFKVQNLPDCLGDRSLLEQVWVNLLSNALKYSGKCDVSMIEIGCVQQSGKDAFYVRDNGVGFDMRYAHKLFGVFQRLHRAEEYEGTGVGLAIVQRVIHRHEGTIWAESEPNRGATFCFTLGGNSNL